MASSYRLYIHSPAGAGAPYERWDTGLLPDAPVPGLSDLGQLPQAQLDPEQFASYQEMADYAAANGQTLHPVTSVEQAVAIINGSEQIPPADSTGDFLGGYAWLAAAAAALLAFVPSLRRAIGF